MNDEPPVCTPPHLEIQTYANFRGPLIRLNCLDKDSPQDHLSYSITGGKECEFKLFTSTLFHMIFTSYILHCWGHIIRHILNKSLSKYGNKHSYSSSHCLIISWFLGNTNNQFTLWREGTESPSLATGQNFQDYLFQGIQDGVTFQLLIEVTDELGENPVSQLTATTTVIIHVLPWTTAQPTSSRETTPTTVSKSSDLKFSRHLN